MNENRGWSIVILCEILNLSRSGYYKWLRRESSSSEAENKVIVEEISKIYQQVNCIYDYRRMTIQVNKNLKSNYNKKRIRRIMLKLGIQSIIRRRRAAWKRSTPMHVAENILNRQFDSVTKPNQVWCTDVTEFTYSNGSKIYLSALIDLFDKSIISFVTSARNDNELVMDTLKKAFDKYPDSHPLIHSDRGFQYTSNQYKILQEKYGFEISMSRVSKYLDNQPIENFWGTLKSESYYLNKYPSKEKLLNDIKEYIHFYNHYRIMTKYDGLSPIEYRTKFVA